jgi:hypothetical protein
MAFSARVTSRSWAWLSTLQGPAMMVLLMVVVFFDKKCFAKIHNIFELSALK